MQPSADKDAPLAGPITRYSIFFLSIFMSGRHSDLSSGAARPLCLACSLAPFLPNPPPPLFSPATFLGLGYLLPRRFINEIVRLADGNTLRIRTYTLTGLRTFEVWGGRGGGLVV